jgi:Na+/melibiose symporter-like transporter
MACRLPATGLRKVPETTAFGLLLITATLTLPLWNVVSRRTSKRFVYVLGMSLWVVVQLLIWSVAPGRPVLCFVICWTIGNSY